MGGADGGVGAGKGVWGRGECCAGRGEGGREDERWRDEWRGLAGVL